MTRVQADALEELRERGGAVITSEWVNGHGNYITRRAVPLFSDRIDRAAAMRLGTKLPRRIRRVFDAHPRCEAVIAITDMRGANKALAREADSRWVNERFAALLGMEAR